MEPPIHSRARSSPPHLPFIRNLSKTGSFAKLARLVGFSPDPQPSDELSDGDCPGGSASTSEAGDFYIDYDDDDDDDDVDSHDNDAPVEDVDEQSLLWDAQVSGLAPISEGRLGPNAETCADSFDRPSAIIGRAVLFDRCSSSLPFCSCLSRTWKSDRAWFRSLAAAVGDGQLCRQSSAGELHSGVYCPRLSSDVMVCLLVPIVLSSSFSHHGKAAAPSGHQRMEPSD